MTPDEAWMGLLDCGDETHGDSVADDIAHHRPIIDAALTANLRDLVRELADAYHRTGSIRDHSDYSDLSGWHVKGIKTCADPLCVDALAALGDRAADGLPEDTEAMLARFKRAAEDGLHVASDGTHYTPNEWAQEQAADD